MLETEENQDPKQGKILISDFIIDIPSPSPKSQPKIPKSQIIWGKGEFGLWAVTKFYEPHTHPPHHPITSYLLTTSGYI